MPMLMVAFRNFVNAPKNENRICRTVAYPLKIVVVQGAEVSGNGIRFAVSVELFLFSSRTRSHWSPPDLSSTGNETLLPETHCCRNVEWTTQNYLASGLRIKVVSFRLHHEVISN